MLLMKLYNKISALLLVLLLMSCGGNETNDGDDTTNDENESRIEVSEAIVGTWLIEESTRSGKKVPFEGLTVSYTADGTFTSNLFDDTNSTPFEEGLKATIDGSNIYFDESDISYYVEDISDSLLVLSTEIKNFPFEFTFKKAE